MIELVPYRSRQYNFLKIPPFSHHVIHRVFMADMDNILFNNGSGIEVSSHIMTGSANDLYTASICGMILRPPGKAGRNE